MKRLAIPLYKIIKEGKFMWTKVDAESYGNLLYLISLQIRNHIFDPGKPVMCMCDTFFVKLLFHYYIVYARNPSLFTVNPNPRTHSLVTAFCIHVLETSAGTHNGRRASISNWFIAS